MKSHVSFIICLIIKREKVPSYLPRRCESTDLSLACKKTNETKQRNALIIFYTPLGLGADDVIYCTGINHFSEQTFSYYYIYEALKYLYMLNISEHIAQIIE